MLSSASSSRSPNLSTSPISTKRPVFPTASPPPLPTPQPPPPRQGNKPTPLVAAAASFAAAAAVVLHCSPVEAGILSGFGGIESIPGPEVPRVNFLDKWKEENQRKYAELDQRFKSSALLEQLLEKSKANQQKNRRELLDKYCLRGAEWGIGDCSTAGMSDSEKEEFILMLKKRIGASADQ